MGFGYLVRGCPTCPEFSVGWPHAALLLPWLLHSASSLADFHANPSSLSILPVACLSQSACPEPACSLHHRAPGCVCRERWGWEMGVLALGPAPAPEVTPPAAFRLVPNFPLHVAPGWVSNHGCRLGTWSQGCSPTNPRLTWVGTLSLRAARASSRQPFSKVYV